MSRDCSAEEKTKQQRKLTKEQQSQRRVAAAENTNYTLNNINSATHNLSAERSF